MSKTSFLVFLALCIVGAVGLHPALAQQTPIASRDVAVKIAEAELKAHHAIPAESVLSEDPIARYRLRSASLVDEEWIVRVVFDDGINARFLSVAVSRATGEVLRVWTDLLGA